MHDLPRTGERDPSSLLERERVIRRLEPDRGASTIITEVHARHGLLPRLDYLHDPMPANVRFATSDTPQPAPAVVLVHGLGRGGMQTALVLGPPQSQG